MQYIKQIPNELVIAEIKNAILVAYPTEHNKTFVTAKTIIREIMGHSDIYPLVANLPSDRYRKTVVTQVIKNDLNWKIFCVSRGTGDRSGAVFVRGALS
jgi:hypothetical protein